MKFSIDRASLLKSLSHVQSVVEKRGTIPILSNIKVEATGNQIELTATDMDVAMVDQVNAKVEKGGATTIPAHMLYEIIRKLPDGADIVIEDVASEGKVRITTGHSKFALSTLAVDDFPAMAEGELAYSFVLTGAECRALIEKTRFAMSTEETRYYLNGVYLHAHESNGSSVLRSVATDGHRLARLEIPLPAGASGMPGVIIPRKTIAELSKLLEDGIEQVKISLSDTKIRFLCGNATLVSKLIDGTYPDYERVVPQNNTNIMEVDSSAFAKAVDRVSVIAADKIRGIKLTMGSGKLTLSASSPEHGTAQETLEVAYSADPIEIGFNARYIMDIMSEIEGGNAQFVFNDSNSPALVRDSADVGALYVLMPMRV